MGTLTGMAAVTGAVIAQRYRLDELLGRGGMGAVWHAHDERLGRDVAIKEVLLPPELNSEERDQLVKRTLREARAAARLSHPNVVTVYDVVEADGRPWIVMELVRSRTLSAVLREQGPLPPREAAEIGLQVLAALRAAHTAGILHRDVKPANILRADEGRVVLTDFGIASLEGDPSLTQSGLFLGSPAYVAPERALGQPAVAASDLWSLGATLFTLVEGRPPYDRGSALATLAALATEEPAPCRAAGPLAPVLEALLSRDPAARPDAMATRLQLSRVVAQKGTRELPAVVQPGPAPPRPTITRTQVLQVPHDGGARGGAGGAAAAAAAAAAGAGPGTIRSAPVPVRPRVPAPGAAEAPIAHAGAVQEVEGPGARVDAARVSETPTAREPEAPGARVAEAPAARAAEAPTTRDEEPPLTGLAALGLAPVSPVGTSPAGDGGTTGSGTGGTTTAPPATAPPATAQTAPARTAPAQTARPATASVDAARTTQAPGPGAPRTPAPGTTAPAAAPRAGGAPTEAAPRGRPAREAGPRGRPATEAAPAPAPQGGAERDSPAAGAGPATAAASAAPGPASTAPKADGPARAPSGDTRPVGAERAGAARADATTVAPERAATERAAADRAAADRAAATTAATPAATGPASASTTTVPRASGTSPAYGSSQVFSTSRPSKTPSAPGTARIPTPLAPPAPPGARPRSRRRWPVLAGTLAALLLVGVPWGWSAIRPENGDPGSDGRAAGPTVAVSEPAPGASADASPSIGSGSSSAPASPSPPASAAAPPRTSDDTAAVPPGFVRYTDPSGFSLAVPAGFSRSRDDDGRLTFTDRNGRLLIVDQSRQPKSDAVADWTQQEAARRKRMRDYRRIAIRPVSGYPGTAADWEFTYTLGSLGPVRVVNRGFVTGPDQAYGLYWRTPVGQWEESKPIFDTIVREFRPRT